MERIEAELTGKNYTLVNNNPDYYHKGDIIVDGEILEIKSDCRIMESGNILFEDFFLKPVNGEKITKKNKNKLFYVVKPGWLRSGKYKTLIFYDMKNFDKFIIDFSKAKDFIKHNEQNTKIVKKIKDKLNTNETYYLVPYKILEKEKILEHFPIKQPLKGWLKVNFKEFDYRMLNIMRKLHFIPFERNVDNNK